MGTTVEKFAVDLERATSLSGVEQVLREYLKVKRDHKFFLYLLIHVTKRDPPSYVMISQPRSINAGISIT